MRIFVLAAAVSFLASCDGPPPPPPPVEKPPPEFPGLPDIKPTEDFAKDGHLELAPGDATAFAWDLRADVHHNYSYEQESHLVVAVTGPESGRLASRTQWKGGAEVIGGGGRGEIVFLSSPIAQWNNNQPLSSEELNKVKKMLFKLQVREDGTIASRQMLSGQEDPKLDLFFALPSKELKAGEKDVREVHIATIAEDLKYHGRQEITHAGRRKVGRHECVKLLSRVELEANPPGDGLGKLVGWVAGYFDPKERKFIHVDAAFVMAVDVRRQVRPADPKAEVFWQMHRVQADTRVTLVLKD